MPPAENVATCESAPPTAADEADETDDGLPTPHSVKTFCVLIIEFSNACGLAFPRRRRRSHLLLHMNDALNLSQTLYRKFR